MKRTIFFSLLLSHYLCANRLYIPVSHGELIDKITILEIKTERITDQAQLAHIKIELAALRKKFATFAYSYQTHLLIEELSKVNRSLWDVEDALREKENSGTFDAEFVDLARKVYLLNDERYALKKQISQQLDSSFIEQKSYHQHETKS